MAKTASGKPRVSGKGSAPGKVPASRKGAVNPALAAQTRKVMGKHYAAKYGVRKERG